MNRPWTQIDAFDDPQPPRVFAGRSRAGRADRRDDRPGGELLAERYDGPQLLFALLFGMAFNFSAEGLRVKVGIDFASKKILRFGVALLGARIGLEQIVALGVAPAAIVVVAVVGTILCGRLLSRLLRWPAADGLLTGGAVAMCGAPMPVRLQPGSGPTICAQWAR